MLDKRKAVDKEIKHAHIHTSCDALTSEEKSRGVLQRIRCKKPFNVQGIPVVANEVATIGKSAKKNLVGPVGGCVQGIQCIDDTSWICSKAEVYYNAFVENESFIDGIAKVSGYTTLSHVMTGKITFIKHSYMHNCNLQGLNSVEFSEINRPIDGKTSKVKVEFEGDTKLDNVSIEFTNIPKVKTPKVGILTIDPIVDVSFKLPVAKFYVIVNNYAFDLSNDIMRTELFAVLANGCKTNSFCDIFDYLFLKRNCVPMIEGKTKPPIVATVGAYAYARRNGYDWSGKMIETAFIESRKQKANAVQNTCVENSTTEQVTIVTSKEEINYDEKLNELKGKARELGVEL